ncbi:unnamed protein product [Lupinus luteus]|uniref:Uncharacterized protein n=1 Tax=Lupinus luteus TaxID=3873 RepID=A0AAV1VYY2_LUPLU
MARHGSPPNAPAGYPKHAGAFFHGVVGSSTESSSMPNPDRTWPGAGWPRAEASSVAPSARKDVVLGGAFRGVAAARRGASPITRK